MNNVRLISKYGEKIKLNGVNTKAYFEESKKTYYLRKQEIYTSFEIEVIHTREKLTLDDILVLKGDNFEVLDTMPVYTSGNVSYCETLCYKDDFTKDITIKNQSLNMNGCNLPNAVQASPIEAKARLKTIKPLDYLNYSFHNDKKPTHIFTLKFIDGVMMSDLIEWGERNFEVLAIENINENNKLLAIYCIEVL
ncbi:MAG: hypothetical protein RBR93_08610 [Aliarcobacter butzleri]|nr:hypothetical protein [Aliarcobacter butzleri]